MMEVKQHLRHNSRKTGFVGEEPDLTVLPICMRRKMMCEARAVDICGHPVFYSMRRVEYRWYDRVACDAFKASFHSPSDSLFISGEIAETMYFVTHGRGTYLKCNDG